MINDLVQQSDYAVGVHLNGEVDHLDTQHPGALARTISAAENYPEASAPALEQVRKLAAKSTAPILGITGTGGAGKSSLVDEMVRRYLMQFPDKTIGIISVDPSKRKKPEEHYWATVSA